MKNKHLDNLIKEIGIFIGIYIVLLLIFKLVFINENLFIIIKIVSSLFWLFIIPGWTITYYWRTRIDMLERMIIGTAISAAILGIFSYYLGVLGFSISYHSIILPLIMLIISMLINLKKLFPSSSLK